MISSDRRAHGVARYGRACNAVCRRLIKNVQSFIQALHIPTETISCSFFHQNRFQAFFFPKKKTGVALFK
jgi:hypothetical protein